MSPPRFSRSLFSAAVLGAAAQLLAPPAVRADLNVNGTPNAQWNNTGTMTYDTDPTDPTSQSNGQFVLNGGGSLAMTGGTLTLTNTNFGVFVGQNPTAGTINLSGGNFTWNANGGSEQRFVFGNAGATGMLTVTGGTFDANTGAGTDTSRGLTFGRGGGSGTANLSGTGIFTSASDRFGMDGSFNNATTFAFDNGPATSAITLGSGTPQFILNGLADTTAANFAINTGSFFSFTTGSSGKLELATGNGTAAMDVAVPQTFFDGLVTAGAIRIDGATATPGQFTYSTDGVNNLGVYQLAASVPEPTTWAMMLGGMGILVGARRLRRRV